MSDPVSQSIGRMLRGEQHIGDTRDMTTRERLAWIAYSDTSGHLDIGAWHSLDEQTKDIYRGNVDAILRELMEPSEGMLIAGQLVWEKEGCYGGPWGEHHAKVLQAMLQHILDEPQQEDDAP